MIEQMKQWLEALEECRRDPRLKYDHPALDNAITSLRQAIAEAEKQEPVAWQERHAKRMKDGVVTEWTNWYPCRYRTIDEAQAEASDHIPYEWQPLYTHPQPKAEQEPYRIEQNLYGEELKLYTHPHTEERNFCPRCGKRTNDIHTCTPPRGKREEVWRTCLKNSKSIG